MTLADNLRWSSEAHDGIVRGPTAVCCDPPSAIAVNSRFVLRKIIEAAEAAQVPVPEDQGWPATPFVDAKGNLICRTHLHKLDIGSLGK